MLLFRICNVSLSRKTHCVFLISRYWTFYFIARNGVPGDENLLQAECIFMRIFNMHLRANIHDFFHNNIKNDYKYIDMCLF